MITQKRRQIIFVTLAGMLLAKIFLVSAITGSMGNARMTLYPEVNGKTFTTIEKTILIRNINNVSANISLKTDADGEKFLEIVDKEFVLQPNEEKKAKFVVKVKEEGNYQGKINVFFSPSEEKGAGVVLTSTITIIAKEDQSENINEIDSDKNSLINEDEIGDSKINKGTIFLLISTLVLLAILICLFVLVSKKNKKKKVEKKDEKK